MMDEGGSLDEVMPMAEGAADGRPSRRFSTEERWTLALALPFFAFGLLYLLKAPWLWLFRLQLLLIECGHWALPALLVLAFRARLRWLRGLALAAAVLALGPSLRAAWAAPRLAAETGLAWGAAATPRRPLNWSKLWLPALQNGVERTEEPYDPERGLSLDLWSRRDDQGLMTRRPIVLVLHGGGWDGGERGGFGDFNAAMARLGWVVADIDYRLAPAHPWPAQREDVMRALEHLRVNAKRLAVDPEHVVLLGRSAGAHLALDFAYGTHDQAIKGVISFYGPADLRFAWQFGEPGDVLDSLALLKQLCGGEPKKKGGCFDDASPYFHVNAGSPPTLLLHGRLDALVWQRQSQRLDQKLGEAGIPHQFVDLPWATHAFDWNRHGPSGQAAWYAVERFLQASERSQEPAHL